MAPGPRSSSASGPRLSGIAGFPICNPQFRGFGPGLILLVKIIREAPQQGVGEIDGGEGPSRYKDAFAAGFHPFHRGMGYRASLRGLAYREYLSLSGGRPQSLFE